MDIYNTEEIWNDYHSSLRSFILNRVGNVEDTDDILQDVFLKIHSKIALLKENSDVKSWAYQITRNTIIDYYRTHKTTSELPEALTKQEPELLDITRQEMASWLLPIIQTMPNPYKEALLLSEIEGLTQKKVAQTKGLSLSGAKSRIQRGRKMMKNYLFDCCYFEFDHQGQVVDYCEKAHHKTKSHL